MARPASRVFDRRVVQRHGASRSPDAGRELSSTVEPTPALHGRTVLLVIIDPALRGFLRRLCERGGHTTLVSRSAEEGLQLLSRHPTRPDAILLDGALAVASDRRGVCIDRFLSVAPSVPLVVLGGPARAIEQPRLRVHASLWWPVPVEGEPLLQAMESLIAATTGRGGDLSWIRIA
jgi:CheY-like chemotaxis protein